jgi:hypothetical protein
LAAPRVKAVIGGVAHDGAISAMKKAAAGSIPRRRPVTQLAINVLEPGISGNAVVTAVSEAVVGVAARLGDGVFPFRGGEQEGYRGWRRDCEAPTFGEEPSTRLAGPLPSRSRAGLLLVFIHRLTSKLFNAPPFISAATLPWKGGRL